MSEEVVKKLRRRKIIPPYSIINHNIEAERNLVIRYIPENDSHENSSLLMTPYSRFIPVEYLLRRNHQENSITFKRSTLTRFESQDCRLYLNQYLFYNKIHGVRTSYDCRINTSKVESAMTLSHYWYRNFYSANYCCIANFHSLFKSSNSSQYPDNELTPIGVLCIARENLIKVKLDLLLHGHIKLKDCIYLVDREVDTPAYPQQPLRKLYKNTIQKFCTENGVTEARVPVSYILDNCFLPKFELKETSVIKRLEEIEKVKHEFHNFVKNKFNITRREGEEIEIAELEVGEQDSISGGSFVIGEGVTVDTSVIPAWNSGAITIHTEREGIGLYQRTLDQLGQLAEVENQQI